MPAETDRGTSSTEQDVASEAARSCTYSSFRKTLRTNNALVALELPATFVKENGHSIQKQVSVRGPSGGAKVVDLSIKSYPLQNRVHFGGSGWRAFTRENGFEVGDQLLFSLVAMSTFTVRLLGRVALHRTRKAFSAQPARRSSSSVVTQHPIITIPPNDSVPGNAENDVVYCQGTMQFKPEVETRLGNLGCPHFVTMIKKSNLRHERSSALSVPVEFQKKYGKYFSKFNCFQGPCGRIQEVCFSGTRYDRFSTGWKAFHQENGIKLGDVLLLSLRAPAFWLVQVVGNQSQEPSLTYSNQVKN